jgi:hypothetical protein
MVSKQNDERKVLSTTRSSVVSRVKIGRFHEEYVTRMEEFGRSSVSTLHTSDGTNEKSGLNCLSFAYVEIGRTSEHLNEHLDV